MAYADYTLMHKDVPVAELTLDSDTGVIASVGQVLNAEHVPVGIPLKRGMIDRGRLNAWWTGRSIPASRDHIRDALQELALDSTQLLLDKCLGLSLSDQYWICPSSNRVSWEEVNFFQNTFSDDVGNILFGHGSSGDPVSLMSPDNTSDGWLKKKWAILDERRYLIKGGSGATQQEPYNEVLASAIMRRLGIIHVPYTLLIQEDYPYSVCENFITPETELIPAWYIMQTAKKPNHISVYQHYLDRCQALGIPGVQEAVEHMIVLDYLIANEDRHQNNFGVIRNAETLEYLGSAPIYDSGTSLWFDKPTALIGSGPIKCKPFKTSHEEQIRLVRSFDWLDFSALDGIEEEWMELTGGSLFLDESRRAAVAHALRSRIDMLKKLSCAHIWNVSGTERDVMEDVRYSGQDHNEQDTNGPEMDEVKKDKLP